MDNIAATGVQAPAAGGQPQGTGAQPAGGQPATVVAPAGQPAAATQPQGEVKVPLHVVTALRDELSTSKKTMGELQSKVSQFEMMQQMGGFNRPAEPAAQPGGGQPPAAQPEQPSDPFTGLEDNDLVNVADLRKVIQTVRGGADINKALEPVNVTLAKVQVQLQDPNYETTIRTYLPEMITASPIMREMITRAPNPILAALTIAKMNPRYQAPQAGGQPPQPPPDILSDLQRIIENATRPGSPGGMGGGGAISGNDRFRNMSDQEFDAEVQRVLSGATR